MGKDRRANLYIRADADLIERGKRYAASQGKSLSRLVEEHFLKLLEEADKESQPENGAHRSAEVLSR
jgi:hypothetical protein